MKPWLEPIATLAVLLSTGAVFAGDVQFDHQAIIQKRLVDEAADRAETCIHSILLVNLYRGVRDRDTLVNAAVAQCEGALTAFLARVKPEFADKPGIHELLISSGYQQLDSIISRGE
jgi:hypothetical protein